MQRISSRLRSLAVPGLVAFLATLAVLTFPGYPYIISDALSEKAVLSYAHQRGWHFGTDLVFTYGPLGFLSSRYFFAHAAALRFATDLLFSFAVCSGVTRLAWRVKHAWRWLLMGTFVFLTANIDPRYDLLLYLGVFSWSVLCFLDSGPRLAVDCACVGLLIAFGALVKANFLILAGLSLGAIIADLFLRGKFRAGIALVLASIGWFLTGWFAAGQSWANLPAFFAHVAALASGYNGAVGLDGLQVLRSRGVIAVCLLATALAVRSLVVFPSKEEPAGEIHGEKPLKRFRFRHIWPFTQLKLGVHERGDARSQPFTEPKLDINENDDGRSRPFTQLRLGVHENVYAFRRIVVALWLEGLVLLVWKHGFVRGDMFHMGFFFGFAPFCAVAIEAFPANRSLRFRLSRIFAVVCWLVVIFTLQRWCLPAFPGSLLQPGASLLANAHILFHPHAFQKTMLESQQTEFSQFDLPKVRQIAGTASVDVFGQDQLYALYNHLNYRPRPVFQSYMAYNSALNRLNEEFYFSSSAPEYVLFRLMPIDHKFPPLEDSWVLRDLLLNYTLSEEDGSYLLLKRTGTNLPALTLLRDVTVHLGERIDLTSFGETNLWMEIHLRPSFAGHIRSALYKPPVTRVVVWAGKSKAPYKAPAPMLEAGFVASPLLLEDNDVRQFYRGGELKRPDAYSVIVDSGGESFWQQTFQCRIYRIESPAAGR